jgi:hypothetical protein
MRFTKKASLNLSINAIVVLILAITMLGLGLAFMRNIFGSATEEFQEVSGTVQKQMIDQMKESNKVVDVSNSKLRMKAGERKQIFIGFKNEDSTAKEFQIRQIEASRLGAVPVGDEGNTNIFDIDIDGIVLDTSVDISALCGIDATREVYLEFKKTKTKVEKGDVVVVPMNIYSTSNAAQGTCIFEIKVDTEIPEGNTDVRTEYNKIVELTVDITS